VNKKYETEKKKKTLKKHSRSFSHFELRNNGLTNDRRIKFNVGGKRFETWVSTLMKYPNTMLGAMVQPMNNPLFPKEEIFFDRDPRAFEVILNFYRNGKLIVPDWLPLELLNEELKYFCVDVPRDLANKRISLELIRLEHNAKLADASEYRRITRHKLLADHHGVLMMILDKFSRKIEKSSAKGLTSCEVKFLSPLHYTNSTPRSIFNIISKNEIRELIVELLEEKAFEITTSNEYSKTKPTAIIGLHDQVTNYNDPKFFSFKIHW